MITRFPFVLGPEKLLTHSGYNETDKWARGYKVEGKEARRIGLKRFNALRRNAHALDETGTPQKNKKKDGKEQDGQGWGNFF